MECTAFLNTILLKGHKWKTLWHLIRRVESRKFAKLGLDNAMSLFNSLVALILFRLFVSFFLMLTILLFATQFQEFSRALKIKGRAKSDQGPGIHNLLI